MLDRFKFRIYDKKRAVMITEDNCNGLAKHYKHDEWWEAIPVITITAISDFIEFYNKDNRFVLMQSTGVHTIGNKLLYTGDLIRTPYDMELTQLVYWNQKETRFNCYTNDFMQCGLYQEDITKYKYEIVGNIFENWNWFRESKAEIDRIIDKYIWEGWEKKFGGENNER